MDRVLLSDEEITRAIERVYPSGTGTYQVNAGDKSITKAQLKKAVEWGEEFCKEHPVADELYRQKMNCSECRQSLLEEVK